MSAGDLSCRSHRSHQRLGRRRADGARTPTPWTSLDYSKLCGLQQAPLDLD